MNSRCCLFFAAFIINLVCSEAVIKNSHSLTKRQLFPRGSRSFPLSRSRQYPPPEELEEYERGDDETREESEYELDSQENPPPIRFRGRQQPPEEEEEYHYTEAPLTTTPTPSQEPSKTPIRIFNNRPSRPRFGTQPRITNSITPSPKPTSRPQTRLNSVPAQRIDVATQILNKPPPPRPSPIRTFGTSRSSNDNESVRKPVLEDSNVAANRRSGNGRVRARGRPRSKSSTTTTTTTTTPAPEEEYYYYYYEDEETDPKETLATTTSTTTTTTTTTQKPPSLPRRPSLARNRPATSNSRTTSKPRAPIKFDIESQFLPPPEDAPLLPVNSETTRSTKRFTTSTTEAPIGGIPAHLKNKYKPRKDGRFVDYLRDPNRPRELKGFDLTDYPFYVKVPDDITFDCEDKKDGYYASVPHHCQLFHYCFAGSRYDFLCANYTLYDQTTFTCRFANNVDCPSSEKYYYRNDDLWKETTTTTTTEAPKKKKIIPKHDDYDEEYEYDDDEYYDDEEDDTKRRRRPYRRRRNRRRKNRRKSSSTATTQDAK